MTMPGDIPRATSAEIAATVAAHRAAPAFTIVPAHDDLGSNTIVMSPPDAVPLRFGEDSFYPHLDAARARGIDPLVVRHPGIGMDIDNPVDLVAFLKMSPPAATRTLAFLEQSGVAARLLKAEPKTSMKSRIAVDGGGARLGRCITYRYVVRRNAKAGRARFLRTELNRVPTD